MPRPARRIGTTNGVGLAKAMPVVTATGVSIWTCNGLDLARCLIGQQGHQLVGQLPEYRRRGVLVSKDRYLMGHQRVVNYLYAHEAKSTSRGSPKTRF